jgi:3-oxoacyl-[acyl-carrier-protein] synthase III
MISLPVNFYSSLAKTANKISATMTLKLNEVKNNKDAREKRLCLLLVKALS